MSEHTTAPGRSDARRFLDAKMLRIITLLKFIYSLVRWTKPQASGAAAGEADAARELCVDKKSERRGEGTQLGMLCMSNARSVNKNLIQRNVVLAGTPNAFFKPFEGVRTYTQECDPSSGQHTEKHSSIAKFQSIFMLFFTIGCRCINATPKRPT